MNTKVADLIASKKCFYLGKIEVPIKFYIPFLLDARKLYSDPVALRVLGQELGKIVKSLSVDRVAGIETASIALAAAISLEFNIPMIYVRKKRKTYGTQGFIEGVFNKGERIVLVDDVVGPGIATKQIYENCQKEQVKATDMVLIMHDPIPKPWAEKGGLKFHQLLLVTELWDYLLKKGVFTEDIYKGIKDWGQNIMAWQKDEEKWKEFIDLVKKESPELLYPY